MAQEPAGGDQVSTASLGPCGRTVASSRQAQGGGESTGWAGRRLGREVVAYCSGLLLPHVLTQVLF